MNAPVKAIHKIWERRKGCTMPTCLYSLYAVHFGMS